MWQYVFVYCNWKVYVAVEFKQNGLFINLYIFDIIMLKMNSIPGKTHFPWWYESLLTESSASQGGNSV